jgi:hypothetical protein
MLAMIVPRYCRFIAPRESRLLILNAAAWCATLLSALVCTGGCATHVIPPEVVHEPATVYLADYGRHASLILPTAPGTLTEYSFGDWTFYAEAKTTPVNAIAALFWSRQSALGRRWIVDDRDPGELAGQLKASVQSFEVERAAASSLTRQLDERYAQHLRTEIFNPSYQTYFVADEEHYGICNNSNRMTARWLGQLGCTIRGPALLSNFVVVKTSSSTTPALTASSAQARPKKPNDS